MKKGYHRYFIFLIFVLIIGCVGCGKKESVEEEGYVIQMEEWAAENIYVSLDEDFRENKSGLRMEADLDLYSLEPEMEEAHAQIAGKYLWLAEEQAAQYKEYPSEEDPLYENKSYGVGTITCTFSRRSLGLMNDLELWEKLAGYFEDRILEKVISTVSSVLTRQTYTIYDMKLMIQATETDYSTGRTVFTPVWVLKMKITDSEGQTESCESFVYDAISGLALERWQP